MEKICLDEKENKAKLYDEIMEKRKQIKKKLRKSIFRFSKALFFYMSIALTAMLTYVYCNWDVIQKKDTSIPPMLNLILLSSGISVFIFISSISCMYDDYKEKNE